MEQVLIPKGTKIHLGGPGHYGVLYKDQSAYVFSTVDSIGHLYFGPKVQREKGMKTILLPKSLRFDGYCSLGWISNENI